MAAPTEQQKLDAANAALGTVKDPDEVKRFLALYWSQANLLLGMVPQQPATTPAPGDTAERAAMIVQLNPQAQALKDRVEAHDAEGLQILRAVLAEQP